MHLLTRFSLKRASIIILMVFFVIGAGIYSAGQLKSELLPNIDLPQVSVIVVYPGAAPDDVRRDVTDPIEKAIAGTSNLKNVTSTSSDSVAFISAEYEYGTDMEKAQQNIQDLVNNLSLPSQVQRPTVGRFSFQDIPVLAYTINSQASGDNALSDLRRNLEDNLLPELKAIPGVNSVSLVGGGTQQVQITYNQAKLDHYGLTASSVNNILQANNISFPTGEVVNNGQSIPVRVAYQFNNISDLQNLVVMPARTKSSGSGTQGGQGSQGNSGGSASGQGSNSGPQPAVKLSDVATVALVNANQGSVSRSNGKPSLSITIYKTQNANTVSVSDAVAAKMDTLSTLVPGAQKEVLFDQASFIKDSLNGLIREGLLGALLAIVVILVFLASLRSTIVTAFSIPLSVLIALTMFNVLGVTLNIMSLAGLAVAIGRVVDDSIVVLENIYRHHFQRGEPIRQAAFNGAKEVATAITSSTITTVCVFLPLGFIAGLVSEFFRPFAIAVTVSLLASLLVALTVIPVLAAFFLKTGKAKDPGPAAEQEEKETWLQRLYTPAISFALKNNWTKLAVVGIALLLFAGSLGLATQLGTSFLSFGSDKVLQATFTMKPGTDLATTDKASQVLEAGIQNRPSVQNYQASAGTSTDGASQGFSDSLGSDATGRLTVTLKPDADLKAEADWLRNLIGSKQRDLNIASYSVSTGTGGGPNSSAYSLIVSGNNYTDVQKASEDLLAKLKTIPSLVDLHSDAAQAKPEIHVQVDPAKALEHGSTTIQIATQVRALLTSQKVTQITIDSRTYNVDAIFDKATLGDINAIKNIKVGMNNPVPLSQVADVSLADGPVSISHVNQERSITLSGTITSNSTSGVTRAGQQAIDSLQLGPGVKITAGGVSELQTEAFTQLGVALAVAVILVYLVMVLTFGSLSTPFIIMFSIPLAAIGSIVALFVTNRPLDVSALIGVLMLVGIVVTNAIVLLDLVEQMKARGFSTHDALIRGGRTRVRPIVMTAIATIFALMPLVLGFSEGSIIASELGTVVVGGLFTSTFLTLIVIPVVYSLLDSVRSRLSRGQGSEIRDQGEFDVDRVLSSLDEEPEPAGAR